MTQRELPGYVKELCKHKLTGLLKNCMGYMTLENIKLAHQLLDLGKTN